MDVSNIMTQPFPFEMHLSLCLRAKEIMKGGKTTEVWSWDRSSIILFTKDSIGRIGERIELCWRGFKSHLVFCAVGLLLC